MLRDHAQAPLRIHPFRLAAIGLALLAGLSVGAPAALGTPPSDTSFTIPVSSAEGIAAGQGMTFYAGELNTGDIYRGDIRTETARLFIDAPAGRQAVGMKVDLAHQLLFVAGGTTGQAYVYSTVTGANVAAFQLTNGPAFINDVALTRDGAWFTNSAAAELYFVPVSAQGQLGTVRTLHLTGPAADTSSSFNLNGILASPDGKTLIVDHTGLGTLYAVDPMTGASTRILVNGDPTTLLTSPDGLVLQGHTMWVMENFANRVTRLALSADLATATVETSDTSPLFQSPSTAALIGNTLAVVNSQFATGAGTPFEIVLSEARR
jgi:sugar lactone lactonase YvrE